MNRTYIFDLFAKDMDDRSHLTIVHCGGIGLRDHEIRAELQRHFEAGANLPPDNIVFTGTPACSDMFKELVSSDMLRLALPQFTRNSAPPALRAACLSLDGTLQEVSVDGRGLGIPLDQHLWDRFQHFGLKELFKGRGALLSASEAFHYVKPSKKHCQKFIRTANVLTRGPEAAFVAFCILRNCLSSSVKFIYVDTSSIMSVAHVLAGMRPQMDVKWIPPIVDSFGSHQGLDTAQFEDVESSLFVLSASTSGDLEERLKKEHGVPNRNIITIFYLGEKRPRSLVLCDATERKDKSEFDGWEPPVPTLAPIDARRCVLCVAGSQPLTIVGDQFLREEVKVNEVLITIDSKPKWMNTLMRDFVGHGIVSCHRVANPTEASPREIFIDVEKAFNSTFKARLGRLVRQVTPSAVGTVIHVNDGSSRSLAQEVLCVLKEKPKLVSAQSVIENPPQEETVGAGTVVVTAGVVVAGQHLMEVSQALRHVQNPIVYLIGLSRTRSEQRLEEIRKNIIPATGGKSVVHCVNDIFLPDDPVWRGSPWDLEIQTLKRLRDQTQRDDVVYELASKRIEVLGRKRAKEGLVDDLFWPTTSGAPLHIRPGFALWTFEPATSTQADVYISVAATLHRWRSELRKSPADLIRTVLAPRNLIRFNDGVIQASFLRAAHPGELDYRDHTELDESINAILTLIFENHHDARGEGCIEFLLAIIEKRLQLSFKTAIGRIEDLEKILGKERRRLSKNGRFALALCRMALNELRYPGNKSHSMKSGKKALRRT